MRTSLISRSVGMALLGSLSLGLALSAHAQQRTPAEADATTASTDKAKNLDSVVVTARSGVQTRTKAETSYSITTIDEDRLRMQAPTSVTEAMKSVPGFWVEASGGEASGNIRARGIPVDGFGSVTLLEDGMPVQHDPALGYLNADQAFRLDETIERIEVVRGGPSSVFYSNAPAGAINFIPRRVGDTPDGLVKYTVGDYGLQRADFWYGTPVGSGWKLGVGGFYRIDDGIRDPGFHANDGGQIRLNLAKDFEHGRFSADVKHMDDKVALYLGIPMRTYPNGKIKAVPGFDGNFGTMAGPQTEHVLMKQGNGSLYDFDNSVGTHVKRDQLTLKFDHDLGADWKLAESMRYSDTKTQRNGVFPNSLMSADKFLAQARQFQPAGAAGLQLHYVDNPAQVFDNQNQNGNGLVVIGGLRGVTMPVQEFVNDTRLLRQFDLGGQSHDVTLGYYYAHFNQDFSRYSSTALLDVRDNARLLDLVAVDAAGRPLGTLTDHGIYRYGYEWENASGSSATHAFYLSDEWQATDALRIDGGVRWERVNTKGWVERKQTVNLGTLATSQVQTGTGQTASYDHSFSKPGWTLGVNWQFSERSGVFARWTSAFRLPNLSSYITNATATPIIQTMKLGEVGYKYSDRQFDLYATAFYTKYDNVGFNNYVFNPNNNTSVAQQGYASTKTKGLELEGTWFPTRWFDVQLTATWQDPQYEGLRYTDKGSTGPILRDYTGNQLIRVPKLSYRVVPGVNLLDGQLRLQLSYEHEGERFVDTANSVRLPSYDVLGASARYDVSPAFSVYLYADNLTNSLGLTEGNPRAGELQSADAGANTFIARPLLGRSYRAAVMYRF
ncbi:MULTISPECIES: TonB-dependent receptor [Rhodanobacter]|uniref:TonB-dependent receptor n=1 Tax=Rhodanobacter TaxID=75309 RepID=UPI001F31BE8E|nr:MULTISPECIES: TonB-dependent receptor [Rhodanobacter]UJJ55397.1 TonB-dependent receptor [Rhodanobacter thiooxydans]